MRKFLNHLSTAASNLLHDLITPRHVRVDELRAREFCEKMRALGEDPKAGLSMAATLATVGATEEQVLVYAKISAQSMVTLQDLNRLARQGMKIATLEWEGK